ncbi:hypothetical protein M2480_001007 [Parabacteroides sp. PFB2-12]|uniref:DUF4296 domain-containing protein n=1 Tax=unclassified Parabacteroides TaxID=2649774 RepID=UPI002474F178|nr:MULTISPECIES: DUF4296 domain-containing protein [unclassified Parabacteroides]MDH6342385.1 hypothetical protein [Parabacteroides sp. PM6-13]MDH6390037.1 hypothetical protein [Parabacteroides sp. PFB2-12]
MWNKLHIRFSCFQKTLLSPLKSGGGSLVVLSFLLLGIACSKAPSGILSEKEMQRVQTDMMVADALIYTNQKDFSTDTAKVALYESVFRKHKITQAVYDSSLIWYGKNLDIYMKMYDRILADVNRRIRDLGDVQAEAAPASNRDSVDIWPRRSFMVFHPKAVFNGITFDIKPDKHYASGSSFVLGMRVWGMPDDMRSHPELRISVVQRDTILTEQATIEKDGYYELALSSMPTRQVQRVYGYVWLNSNDTAYHKIYIDGMKLMRYNYGTPFETQWGEAEPVD